MISRKHRQRILMLLAASTLTGLALFLVLDALKSNINLYLTPSQIVAVAPSSQTLMIGGLVKTGSVHHEQLLTTFVITDGQHDITVDYQGALPSLFQENHGVVAKGTWHDAHFQARTIYAKHNEDYRAPTTHKSLPGEPG